MPDSRSGLPPVGELVQITWADLDGDRKGTGLARLEPNREWFEPLSKGCPHVAAELVSSWCRVLVVPDTDETETAVAVALARHINPDGISACCPRTVLAALREAAIR